MTLKEYNARQRKLPLPDRLFNRAQTLRNDHERCRRSFFKWVCKHELYGALRIVRIGSWISHERGHAKFDYGTPFASGYPAFRNWKSAAYTAWDNEFQAVRSQWIANEKANWHREFEERMQAHEGQYRKYLHNSNAVEVFQLLGAASFITHETHHKD